MRRWLTAAALLALTGCGDRADPPAAEAPAAEAPAPAPGEGTPEATPKADEKAAAAPDEKAAAAPDEKAAPVDADARAQLIGRLVGDWHVDLDSLNNDPALKGLQPQQEMQAREMMKQQMADVRFTFTDDGRVRLGFGPGGRNGTYVVDRIEGSAMHVTTRTGKGDDERVETAVLRIEGDAMWVMEGADRRTIRLLRGPPASALPAEDRDKRRAHPNTPEGAAGLPKPPTTQPTSRPTAPGSQPSGARRAPGSQPSGARRAPGSQPAGAHAPGARVPPGHPGAGARPLPPGHPPRGGAQAPASQRALPPGHPPRGGAPAPASQRALPPGHPPPAGKAPPPAEK